jgi:hypothetical protein
LTHDLSAVPKGAGRAAGDALGIWVESDAKERVPFFRERAQAFEVAHGHVKS